MYRGSCSYHLTLWCSFRKLTPQHVFFAAPSNLSRITVHLYWLYPSLSVCLGSSVSPRWCVVLNLDGVFECFHSVKVEHLVDVLLGQAVNDFYNASHF